MQNGSLVTSRVSWKRVQKAYPAYRYPYPEQVLTVRKIIVRDGIELVYFEEGYFGPYGFLALKSFKEEMPPIPLSQLCDLFSDYKR